jgi:hypothetical protein
LNEIKFTPLECSIFRDFIFFFLGVSSLLEEEDEDEDEVELDLFRFFFVFFFLSEIGFETDLTSIDLDRSRDLFDAFLLAELHERDLRFFKSFVSIIYLSTCSGGIFTNPRVVRLNPSG